MSRTTGRARPRVLAAAASVALLASAVTAPALATPDGDHGRKPPPKPHGKPPVTVQLLSFNDFHGHLQPPGGDPPATGSDGFLSATQDPSRTPVGGVEYLSTTLDQLRSTAPRGASLTVAAGDLIGGSTFLSGIFHDEPSVEVLDELGLDVSSVGNHEFDEGTTELLRMQYGGCHPVDGCYLPDQPYEGADFRWLAANVVKKRSRQPLLPPTQVRTVQGVKVGFIGMTLEETPTLVSPTGVAGVDFLDEVQTANRYARKLVQQGVKSIVVLVHEGGYQTGTYTECTGISDPILTIASGLDPAIDAVVTGHTHQPYICNVPDPAGAPRMVTSAASYGRVVTETDLVIDRRSGDVLRDKVTSTNHLVTRTVVKDPAQSAIIAKWDALSAPLAARVVGSVAADVTGDASGDRGIETPMADLVADAILWGTSGADVGGAQLAFANVGGVRASLLVDEISNVDQAGQVTYEEAYRVLPFNNILVSVDLTGAQIRQALEQQYIPTRGRPNLALGVSAGFGYTWDPAAAQGSRVVEGSMTLGGEAMDMAATYRVATFNFLADGGDSFTAFTQGTNRIGGPEDLANFVAYLTAVSPVSPPADRVAGL